MCFMLLALHPEIFLNITVQIYNFIRANSCHLLLASVVFYTAGFAFSDQSQVMFHEGHQRQGV